MATNHRRITISLPPDVDRALSEFAEAMEMPQSKAVVGILEQSAETMLAMAKVARQLKEGNRRAASKTIQNAFGEKLADLVQQTLDLKASR